MTQIPWTTAVAPKLALSKSTKDKHMKKKLYGYVVWSGGVSGEQEESLLKDITGME